MKLVEILAKELEKWPEGCIGIYQDYDKELRFRGCRITFSGQCTTELASDFVRERCVTGYSGGLVTRADWEAERAKLKAPKANGDGDGWVRNRGRSNKSPVDTGVTCTVKFRDGSEEIGKVGNLRWLHDGGSFDVMRYKIHKPAEQPEIKGVTFGPGAQAITANFDKELGARVSLHNPLEWRDRIRELDTQRAEVESTYQRQISEITQERESLVQKLAAEGLALVEVVVQPVEDMSDCRDWKVGDFVESVSDQDEDIAVGGVYEIYKESSNPTCLFVVDGAGYKRNRMPEDYKFHSRPAS